MDRTTAQLQNEFYTIEFSFYEIVDKLLCFKYRFLGRNSIFKSRSRKVYHNKKGKYFIYERQRVYFN